MMTTMTMILERERAKGAAAKEKAKEAAAKERAKEAVVKGKEARARAKVLERARVKAADELLVAQTKILSVTAARRSVHAAKWIVLILMKMNLRITNTKR